MPTGTTSILGQGRPEESKGSPTPSVARSDAVMSERPSVTGASPYDVSQLQTTLPNVTVHSWRRPHVAANVIRNQEDVADV